MYCFICHAHVSLSLLFLPHQFSVSGYMRTHSCFHDSWVLYEKPDFQGRCIALEEGGIELTNMWAEPGPETEPENLPPMQMGSMRLAVRVSDQPEYVCFIWPSVLHRHPLQWPSLKHSYYVILLY